MIYRIAWMLTTTDVETSIEFSNAAKAEAWANDLSNAGARNVVLEELKIVGKKRFGGNQQKLALH